MSPWQVASLAWGLVLSLAAGAAAETLVLDAVERGVFRSDGSYELGPDAPYSAGRTEFAEERAVLVFALPGAEAPTEAATLRLFAPADGLLGPDRRERVAVHAVASDPDLLVWEPIVGPLGLPPKPGVGTFWDLGTGQQLGRAQVRSGSEGFIEIPLDASILRVLDRTEGRVALGVSVTSLRRDRGTPFVPERVFVTTGPEAGVPAPQLVLVRGSGERPAEAASTFHVDARRGRRGGDGSARRPFRTPAPALDLALAGDVVAVAPGRYVETLILKAGVSVLGAGADRTLLDLGSTRPNLRCADAALSGFLVLRTVASTTNSDTIDCSNGTSPTLTDNAVSAPGRSLLLADSHPVLRRNWIRGAIGGTDSSPTLVENELAAGSSGLALSFEGEAVGAPPRIERNRIAGTLRLQCGLPAGSRFVGNFFRLGLALPGADVPLIQFVGSGDLGLVAGNTFLGGGGILFGAPPPFLAPECDGNKSAKIANNVLAFGSAGIRADARTDVALIANDVFGNRLSPGGPERNYVGVADPTGVDGNFSEDPLFWDLGWQDARLLPESPVIDAGSNDFVGTDVDLHGSPRVVDATGLGEPRVDIGAVEHPPGAEAARGIQIRIEANLEISLPFNPALRPGRPFWVVIPSQASFDAPRQIDLGTLSIEGTPPSRCRIRDVDEDGDEDLRCRFPFESVEGLPRLPTKRVCVHGRDVDGGPILGCDEVGILYLPKAVVRSKPRGG